MSEPLLNVLKLLLLLVLYLFFFRVIRAVWVEVKSPLPVGAPDTPTPEKPARSRRSRAPRRSTGASRAASLVVVEPADQAGHTYHLDDELTVGRAAGCQILVDDNFVSQTHARILRRDGRIMVEDLGSTNGTYLNRERVTSPRVMERGDRLQFGDTVLELT